MVVVLVTLMAKVVVVVPADVPSLAMFVAVATVVALPGFAFSQQAGAEQVPGFVIRKAGCQGAQGSAPGLLVLRQVVVPDGIKCQNRQLHQKHVPGRALMPA